MGVVIGLLFYGETVSHSSDSFPPMLAVDPAGGSSLVVLHPMIDLLTPGKAEGWESTAWGRLAGAELFC